MAQREHMSSWNPKKPYQELPKLPPKAEIESKKILRKCILARTALAELKKSVELIPNPSILISTLPILEARASSEIENIVTTTDRLFKGVGNQSKADPATKEALRYSQALFEGFESLKGRPLNTRTAEMICSKIKGVEMSVRAVPGTALSNETTGEVVYTPPVGEERLRGLLANWETYLHQDSDTDPLIRMAVGHYQFEAIHPFTDGNGRTGRIVNSLFLIEKNLLGLPLLYLSRYILQHRNHYNKSLLNVTKFGQWEEWIEFMLDAVKETSVWTTNKISAIKELAEHTRVYVNSELPKIYSYELVDTIFELPYSRIANITEKGIVQRQTASNYLKALADIGVLEELPTSKEKLFLHKKLLKLLSYDKNEFDRY